MRKTMRITSLFCLLSVLICFALTGCHGARGTVEFHVPDSFDSAAKHEITFWAKNDTNVVQTKIYRQAIEDFQKLYPNITVNLRLYTDYGQIYNDVITNIATNTTPNVCISYPDHIATYLTGTNVVVPLDELMEDEKYGFGGSELLYDGPSSEEMIPEFLSTCAIGETYYALPFMRSTEALYINKTFVEALGYSVPDKVTWDFVWEVSEAAMAKDENGNYLLNGQKVMIPFIYKSTDNMMIQMLRQKGAGYSTDGGEILLFNDTTTELLKTISVHSASGAFSTFKFSSYPANFLNAGQSVFAVDSTAGATWMGSDAPLSDLHKEQIFEFETVVRAVPQFDPDHPQMISQGPSVCIFNKSDPQEVLASWLFAQFLLTNDVQIAYSETEGYVPVTSKAQQSPDYREYLSRAGEDNDVYYRVKLDATRLLLDNIGNTFVTPVFNGSASLRDAAGQLIENVVKTTKRNQTVNDEYLSSMYDNVISLYRLDQISAQNGSAGKADLGEMPAMSKVLLLSLGAIWILIGSYVLISRAKKKNREKK